LAYFPFVFINIKEKIMTKAKTQADYKKIWSRKANKILKGLTVKKIRWMTEKEVKEYDWLGSAPVIEFTDGTIIIASMDDEGNDAGALFTNDSECSVLPRI
jgi:hypothetical protein